MFISCANGARHSPLQQFTDVVGIFGVNFEESAAVHCIVKKRPPYGHVLHFIEIATKYEGPSSSCERQIDALPCAQKLKRLGFDGSYDEDVFFGALETIVSADFKFWQPLFPEIFGMGAL